MMHYLSDLIHVGILRRAVFEILIISVLAGVVGSYLVSRKAQFLAAGLTHATFPGVVIAAMIGGSPFGLSLLFAAGLGLLLAMSRLKVNHLGESDLVGVLLAGMLGLGALFAGLRPGTSRRLSSALVGTLLSVKASDLVLSVLVTAAIVAVFLLCRRLLAYGVFDPVAADAAGVLRMGEAIGLVTSAIAIVMIVPVVGAVQAAALLCIPPLAGRQVSDRFWIAGVVSMLVCAIGGVAGIVMSSATDWAISGCVMLCVVSSTVIVCAVTALASMNRTTQVNYKSAF